jgi:hypothetical protein
MAKLLHFKGLDMPKRILGGPLSRFYPSVIALGVFSLILGYQNCGARNLPIDSGLNGGGGTGSRIVVQGTLEKSLIDGCKFLLRSPEGQYFIPVKLDPALQLDGTTLLIEGSLREDIVTTCMGGTVLQVEKAQVAP